MGSRTPEGCGLQSAGYKAAMISRTLWAMCVLCMALLAAAEDEAPASAVTSRPSPSATTTFQSLMLGYEDVKRVLTRPLLHLEPDTFNAAHPQLYITSAFLDTRPLMFGQRSVLRTMIVVRTKKENADQPETDTPALCRWLTGDGSFHHSPLVRQPYGYSRQRRQQDYLGTCTTLVTEDVLRSNSSTTNVWPVPRFVTVVANADQEVFHDLAWVHVTVIPLIAHDAAEVQKQFAWGRASQGPFLTPEQYEEGTGEVAACMKPIVGGDHFAANLPQWMSFQEATGVSKVFVYMLDPGKIVLNVMQHYEMQGLVERFDFRMSRRLPDPENIANPAKCRRSNVYQRMANQEEGDEWLPCTFKEEEPGEIYYWGQMTAIGHCHMNTMGRYRWVAILDYDEWLVPRLGPNMKYTEMFKKVQANQAELVHNEGQFKVDGVASFREAHSGASWPPAFSFRNTYVCVFCGSQYHNLTIKPWPGAPVKVVVGPDAANPQHWMTPKPSLHEVFWATVRDRVMEENDRSKNIIDPLAVLIMDVHDVFVTWDMIGGTVIKIPTGKLKKWACLSMKAAVCYHVRVVRDNAALTLQHTGLEHRYMAGHAHHVGHEAAVVTGADAPKPISYFLDVCQSCEHPKPAVVEVDFTIANLYGHAILAGLGKFRQTYNKRR